MKRSVLCVLSLLLAANALELRAQTSPAHAAQPEIDISLQQNADSEAPVDVVIELRPDAPQVPFAAPRVITNANGRAVAGQVQGLLMSNGASYHATIGDGVLSARLPVRAIGALRKHPSVAKIQASGGGEAFGTTTTARRIVAILPPTTSMPFLNEGEQQTVVVIDAGFDPEHPALAPIVIEERCYSPSNRFCRNGTASASGPGSSKPLTLGAAGANYHGTSVAAALASQPNVTLPIQGASSGTTGVTESGASPRVNLILISVQLRWPTPSGSTDGMIDLDGVLSALQWVIDEYDRGRRDIKAINLSLGARRTGTAPPACANMPRYQPFLERVGALSARGIAVVAASGNTASEPVALPACVPGVIAVAESIHNPGAPTTLQGSSVGPEIKVAAPAGPIDIPSSNLRNVPLTLVPSITQNSAGGTSLAAPLVTGCAAIIARQLGALSLPVPALTTAMSMSPATASNSLGSFPLLSCQQAYETLAAGTSFLSMNRYGLSGTFYDPATSGQGLVWELTQSYPQTPGIGNFFGAWFTYGPTQNPYHERGQRWYTIQSSSVNFNSQTTALPVVIYQVGPGSFVAPRDPSVTATVMGHGCIRFHSCDAAALTYRWSPEAVDVCTLPPTATGLRQINFTRLGGSYNCSSSTKIQDQIANGTLAARSAHDLPRSVSGSWVRVDPLANHESQGWLFDVNPALPLSAGGAFGAWFTYAATLDPSPPNERWRWLTLQGPRKIASRTYQFDIQFTRDGIFALGLPAPQTTAVGTATLLFGSSCTQAQFSYQFNNNVGSLLTGISGTSGAFEIRKLTPANDPACEVSP